MPGPQAPGLDRAPSLAARDLYRALFPVLAALHPARNPDTGYIEHVTLHTDAHAAREDIEGLARVMAAMPDASSRLASTFGKWPGLFARLCLTFHLIEAAASRVRNPNGLHPPLHVVTAETANRVRRYMRAVLAPSLLRAETLMFGTVQTEHAARIANYILAHRLERVTAREIVRAYRHPATTGRARHPQQHDGRAVPVRLAGAGSATPRWRRADRMARQPRCACPVRRACRSRAQPPRRRQSRDCREVRRAGRRRMLIRGCHQLTLAREAVVTARETVTKWHSRVRARGARIACQNWSICSLSLPDRCLSPRAHTRDSHLVTARGTMPISDVAFAQLFDRHLWERSLRIKTAGYFGEATILCGLLDRTLAAGERVA